MAREHTVVRGIVLRGTDTKESDKILTVLTAGMGKLTVIAKGARSRRSRVAAAVQTLAYSEMVLSESRGGSTSARPPPSPCLTGSARTWSCWPWPATWRS